MSYLLEIVASEVHYKCTILLFFLGLSILITRVSDF